MNKIGHTEESRGDVQKGKKKRAIKFRFIGSDIRPLLIITKDSVPNEYVIQETKKLWPIHKHIFLYFYTCVDASAET